MNKHLYIIPGWDDTYTREPYQKIAEAAREKGYTVHFKEIDWSKKLSEQSFVPEKHATLFGFSLGAVFAWLTAQENRVDHIMLASMTPLYSFKDKKIYKALVDLVGEDFTEDIAAKIKDNHLALKQTMVYGDQEGEPADILVKDTDHDLNANYVEVIAQLL